MVVSASSFQSQRNRHCVRGNTGGFPGWGHPEPVLSDWGPAWGTGGLPFRSYAAAARRKGAPDFELSLQAWTPLDQSTPEPAWRSAWTLEMPSLWKPSTQTLTVSLANLPGVGEWMQAGGFAILEQKCLVMEAGPRWRYRKSLKPPPPTYTQNLQLHRIPPEMEPRPE